MTDSEHRARQLVAQLELISHAPAANLDGGARSSEHPGGRRPPGDAPRRDDIEPLFGQKSHVHFRRRLARCHSDAGFEAIAVDAQAALDAWKRTPPPPQDSIPWQEKVANDHGTIKEIAVRWNLSTGRVHQLQVRYKRAA